MKSQHLPRDVVDVRAFAADCPGGLLMRFDVPPTEAIRAEVMILVKGPWKARPTQKPRAIRAASHAEAHEAKGEEAN